MKKVVSKKINNHHNNECSNIAFKKDKIILNDFYDIFLLNKNNNLYEYILIDNNKKSKYYLYNTRLKCFNKLYFYKTFTIINISKIIIFHQKKLTKTQKYNTLHKEVKL